MALYGGRARGSLIGATDFLMTINSGATLASGDIVNFSSGELDVAGAGERILGVVVKAAVSTTNNVQVNATPFLRLIMDNDNVGTTFAATHVGFGFDITGATGAQVVDTSTATDLATTTNSAQLACTAFQPQFSSSTGAVSLGEFTIKEHVYGTN